MGHVDNIKALFIILNAGHADEVIDIARDNGVKGATILHARGAGARHESFMGITVDSEKEMVLCIVEDETSVKTMAAIKEKAGIKTPAHCICFTLPVEDLLGISLPQYVD